MDKEMKTRGYSPAVIAKLGALLNSVAAEVAADSIETKRIAFFRCEFFDLLARR